MDTHFCLCSSSFFFFFFVRTMPMLPAGTSGKTLSLQLLVPEQTCPSGGWVLVTPLLAPGHLWVQGLPVGVG